MLCFVLHFITPIVHRHGRGTRLGTCLVHAQCVSCIVASAACMPAHKYSVLLMMTQCWLCMGMDEARALVRSLCNSSVSRVSLLCSMFQCFDFLVGWEHAQGIRLGTWPMYAACGVAFVARRHRCWMALPKDAVRMQIAQWCKTK